MSPITVYLTKYKDTEGYTHGAMFYTHNDHMYNYFDQNVENLYA